MLSSPGNFDLSQPARSTLSDAMSLRDWRIYHALAMRLITRAGELYAKESLDIDPDATVYALDATTIARGEMSPRHRPPYY